MSAKTFQAWLLALTMFALTSSVLCAQQPKSAGGDSTSRISTATGDFPEDEAFALYQRVTKGMTPPKATHAPDPQYPEIPAYEERNGVVVMLVGINVHGHVEPVRVVRSSSKVFEKSAVDTVRKWKFKPAKKDGQAVPVQVTVEMKFSK